jgi:hypothetical protein
MNANKVHSSVGKIYDYVNIALWATLTAFILYFAAFVAPNVPEARAQAERLRIQEIASEYNHYCQKWGMPTGTPSNPQCVLDLQAFRAKVEKRIADENGVF